jgi:hypothetical protein
MSTFIFLSIGGGSGTNIPVVANYNALIAAYPPPNTTHLGQFVFVENAQGTWWIPGPVLGTYYPAGLYYCNGTDWKTADVPYQATQVEVDAGTVTDKFVSPETFNNSTQLASKLTATVTSPLGGDVITYNPTTSIWENSHPFWTIDLMDNSSVEFYAVQDVKINSITNIVGLPSITIADDGTPYTLGNTIISGSKITVTSNIQSVVKLNIEL